MSIDHRVTVDRRFAHTHRYTFTVPEIRDFVEARLVGRVLNVCAGRTRLRHDGEVVTNDIDPDIPTDYSLDLAKPHAFAELDECFDTIVFDPPFSIYKSNQKYNGRHVGEDRIAKDNVASVAAPGATVISFGYNSDGLGEKRGFTPREIVLWNHPGRMNDTITVVEERTSTTLVSFAR